MFKQIHIAGIFLLSFVFTGCSLKQATYMAAGSALGGGVGYSYHHNTKDAAIGALAGGVIGATVGGIEQQIGSRKYKNGYDEGYKKAQTDIAIKNWEDNTGKDANQVIVSQPRLIEVKVPKKEQDNVVYDDHYIVLEDYR